MASFTFTPADGLLSRLAAANGLNRERGAGTGGLIHALRPSMPSFTLALVRWLPLRLRSTDALLLRLASTDGFLPRLAAANGLNRERGAGTGGFIHACAVTDGLHSRLASIDGFHHALRSTDALLLRLAPTDGFIDALRQPTA